MMRSPAVCAALLLLGSSACSRLTPAERRARPRGFTPGSAREGDEVEMIFPDAKSPLLTWSPTTVTLREGAVPATAVRR